MKISSIIVFTLFTANIFWACFDKATKKTQENVIAKRDTSVKQLKMNFKQTIDTIEKKSNWVAAIDLFNVKEFIKLFETSELYKDDALYFLSNDSNNSQQKKIAIYAMQKLPVDEYINFFARSTEIYLNGKFADNLLILIIVADFSSDDPIIKSYSNNEVKMSLTKIKNDKKASADLRNWIEEILSGKTWEEKEDFKIDNK